MTDNPKSNLLISIDPKLEEDLRILSKILYPNKDRGGLSLTAEEAIKTIVNKVKYRELIEQYRKLAEEARMLKEDVTGD